MSEDLADSVTRALHHGAALSPPPPRDLAAQVIERSQRRRGRVVALAAALAVLVVLAAGVGFARSLHHPTPAPVVKRPTTVSELGTLHTLPERLGGWNWNVQGELPDGRFLALSWKTVGTVTTQRILVVGIGAGGRPTTQVIATSSTSTTENSSQWLLPIGGDQDWIVWSLERDTLSQPLNKTGSATVTGSSTTVYGLRRTTGSTPRVVVDLTDSGGTVLGYGGGKVYLQASATGPVRQVAVENGTLSKVPATPLNAKGGTVSFRWPWLVSQGSDPVPMVNLVTGARRTAKFQFTHIYNFCTANWCLGGGQSGKPLFIQRWDGSGRHDFLGFTIVDVNFIQTSHPVLLHDRYFPIQSRTADGFRLVLLDAETGAVVPVSTKTGSPQFGVLATDNYLFWSTDPGFNGGAPVQFLDAS